MTSVAFPNKKRLENTIMDMKQVWRTDVLVSSIGWKIDNFNNLKPKTRYWNKGENPDWTFTITKERRFYAVTISTGNYDGDIACFVCYDKRSNSSPIIADRLTGGEYEVIFPNSVIDVPQNKCLKANIAEFNFRLSKRTEVKRLIIGSKALFNTPPHPLRYHSRCCNFFNIMEQDSLKDFTVYAEQKPFRAHKAVLVSRSSYFRKYIQENCRNGERGEIVLDAAFDIMSDVIFFMYTGYLMCDSKEHRNQILVLAEKLGVSNVEILRLRYMEYFGIKR